VKLFSKYFNVTHRRTTCHGNTSLLTQHRAVKSYHPEQPFTL